MKLSSPFGCVFGFVLLTIVGLLSVKQAGYAQGPTQAPQENEATMSAKVEYDLAYPGILPDNPLYKLKVLRDKISLILITDPKKRIEYYLLQTDKGLLASAILVDKKKFKLAKETALKAEDNYTHLTFELKQLPEKPSQDFFKKLEIASVKHQEVLQSLAERVPDEEKPTFKTVLNFSRINLQTVKKQEQKRTYNQE